MSAVHVGGDFWYLMPMVGAFDGYVEKPGRVSSTCLVSVERNHYSVPCEYAGKRISKRLYPQRIDILYQDRVVASHQRLFDRGSSPAMPRLQA